VAVTLTMSTAAFAQDDDAVLKPAEPDYTLVSLPTSLRLPKWKSAFRVTHRFTRPLNCDTCPNSLFGDAFGIDNGARIGLEYRFGIVPNGEIGVHRASDKTVELFGQYGLTRQGKSAPVETSALVALDATNVGNRRSASEYAPAVGLIVTRLVGDQAALYVEPIFVHHANVFNQPGDDNTFMVGLGTRVRVRPTIYFVGEFDPRVSGFRPGKHHGAVGLEKRVGGHVFQLNFSNSFATTLNQLARGGNDDWYMGFNISRKFF
jgi:hypothetical protein